MRASVLVEPGLVRLDKRPVPQLEPGDVLVEIAAVGVCGSDVHYFHDGRIGDFIVEEPMILGHEASGTIVAVGSATSPDRIGQRVSIEPQRPCRACEHCKRGAYNLCTSMEFYATPPIDGAFAQFATIPSDFAHPIPDSVSFEAAALCEPLSVGIWSCQKAQVGPGSRLLVAGAGPIGIIVMQVAFAFGASEVIVADVVDERRAAAERFGATRTIDPRAVDIAAEELEVDAFIDASGAAPAVASGVTAVRPGGHVVLVGMGADDMTLPVARIQQRELLLTGVFRYANTWPLAIELLRTGRVDLDGLVSARFALDEVAEALEAATRPDTLKIIVEPR